MPKHRWTDDVPVVDAASHPPGASYGWGPGSLSSAAFGPGMYGERCDFGSGWHGPPKDAPRHPYAVASHMVPRTDDAAPVILPMIPPAEVRPERKAA